MDKTFIAEAATVEEAIDKALEELGVQQDAVDYTVLDEPGKKMFGLGGSKQARVQVTIKESYIRELAEALSDLDGSLETENHAGYPTAGVVEDLSDDQIDVIADSAIEVLKELARFCGAENVTVEEFEGDEGEIILDIMGDNLGFLIGRHGRTVDALQVAVSSIVTKKTGTRYPISVDVEGYKHRRKQKVVDIALRAADRAKKSGKPASLRPMTPQERRVVHIALRDMAGVTTSSEGSGEYRHVVILPVR